MDPVIQDFDDLPPQQRAIAYAMIKDWRLHYALDTQTGFTVDPVEASMYFDGSIVIPRDAGPYSLKGYPKIMFTEPEF